MESLTGTTEDRWTRRWPWILGLVATGAWVLRALPFFHRHGALGHIIHFDESVYFAASSMLWRGLLPYRDFVFVHPPGSSVLLATVSWLSTLVDPAVGLAAARYACTLAGAVSTFLAGRLALKLWGPAAGLAAALAYGLSADIVDRERGPFLDPLLNLTCLALATACLLPVAVGRERRRAWIAGALAGLAVAVKALGAVWAAAAVLSRAPGRWHARFILASGLTLAALFGPFFAASPSGFIRDVWWFQTTRVADGDMDRWFRLKDMLPERRWGVVVLVLLGLAVALVRTVWTRGKDRTPERFVALAYVLSIAANLLARSYWTTYNAFLAPAEALLAGLGAGALVGWGAALGREWGRRVAFAVVVLIPFHSLRETLKGVNYLIPDQARLSRYMREQVPPEAVVCSFDPGWLMMGGRLPPILEGAPVVVDSYALQLEEAMAAGAPVTDATAAMKHASSQTGMRTLLERCDFTILGWRGRWQLSPENYQWFEANHVQRVSSEQWLKLDIWERTGR